MPNFEISIDATYELQPPTQRILTVGRLHSLRWHSKMLSMPLDLNVHSFKPPTDILKQICFSSVHIKHQQHLLLYYSHEIKEEEENNKKKPLWKCFKHTTSSLLVTNISTFWCGRTKIKQQQQKFGKIHICLHFMLL